MRYILALNQGTTSSRAIIFDEDQRVVSSAQKEFKQIYPKNGWVEHDPEEIWSSQEAVMQEALNRAGIDLAEISAIGITNQRETTIVWDKNSGKPVYNAIVWQCRRTASAIEEIKTQKQLSERIKSITGLLPDAYFSATKIDWILSNVDGARAKADNGELLFGTVDTWLVWKLTNGRVHATDHTNASRTMLYNLDSHDWDDELLKLFNIPRCMLPEIRFSADIYGTAEYLHTDIPIAGVAGDQQSALFGQCCFSPGMAKNTYGTGCFLLMNTGTEKIRSQNGLITTVTAAMSGEPIQYALEGSVFIGGAVVQWLRDELKLISHSREIESVSRSVKDTGGVYLVPAFTGLGAPYWDMYARGAIVGITRSTVKEQIVRAAEEAIAYQTADLFLAMKKDAKAEISEFYADGGASEDSFLMQFQSDILNVRVIKPLCSESTALGAAFLAGLYTGVWKDRNELISRREIKRIYSPDMPSQTRERLFGGWHKAVGRSFDWAESV